MAIEFVNWLTDQGRGLDWLQQGHLDQWVVPGPTTRLIIDSFLGWAIKTRLVASDLTVPKHRRGISKKLTIAEQDDGIQQVVHTDDLTARDRAAGILVLVFAQQIENVLGLTWDDVLSTDDLVMVQPANLKIALPEPLDDPWRQLAVTPSHDQTAAHPHSNWVFRGHSPGQPIRAMSLRQRLRTVFGIRAARLGTIAELGKLSPVAIIAETLGYHPATIQKHAVSSAANYASTSAPSAKSEPINV